MAATDVAGTLDTSGVVGNTGPAPTGTANSASVPDTTPTGGAGGGDNNKAATQPDTAAVQGGTPFHDSYAQGTVSQVLGTVDGGGAVAPNANPAYRAPAAYGAVGSTVDTSLTDKPISDGSSPSSTSTIVTGNIDMVNPTVPLQTTTTNKPVAPGTPTVVAGDRKVIVSWSAVADPGGAKVRGYRIEGSTGGVTFAPRNATSIEVTNLVPSQSYKFRIAAVNDNGQSPWSAFSAAVTPTNPDEPGPGLATTIDEANRANPVYLPDGSVKPGTNGTPGRVASVAVAATATPGQLKVDWSATLEWGTATGYVVRLSTGESQVIGSGATVTHTFTGLSNTVARSATVTPTNARGNGIARTSAGTATPL